MKGEDVKSILLICLGFVFSGLLLTVIQPPISFSVLAWVAYVPFILVCSAGAKLFPLILISYLVSLCYWLGNMYWMGLVTVSGWIAFCVYTALLWPALVVGLRFCRAKKMPLFLAVAVLVVGAERLQGLFLGGFFWRYLAHSQYANIRIIQIADIFGAAGVSFLVGMVNGLIAELIIAVKNKRIFTVGNIVKAGIVFVAVVGTIIYGQWRISQTQELVEAGPMVGSVQSNVPQSVKDSPRTEDKVRLFEELVENSNACVAAGAELIVWPETMVQATLDSRILGLLSDESLAKIFDNSLKKHSNDKAFVLIGAHGGVPKISKDLVIEFAKRYNSAFLYRPDGSRDSKQYNKIHLVPFGEVVPFKKTVPLLYKFLMKFTPYDYDYSLDAGEEYTVFKISSGEQNQRYRFGVMICYEDAVPEIAREFALDEMRSKNIDLLVNISNDGWFVRFKDGEVLPSTELAQHTAICAFRAVENRLAVVRSVNTGISCLIDTVGRVRDGFVAGTLPKEAMDREGVAGWFVDKVPVDGRITFFSKYGQWLDFCCAVCVVSLIIVLFLERFVFKGKPVNM